MEEIRCKLVCLQEFKHLHPGHFVSGEEDDQNFCERVLHEFLQIKGFHKKVKIIPSMYHLGNMSKKVAFPSWLAIKGWMEFCFVLRKLTAVSLCNTWNEKWLSVAQRPALPWVLHIGFHCISKSLLFPTSPHLLDLATKAQRDLKPNMIVMQQEQTPAVFQGLKIFFFLCSNSYLNTRQSPCLKLFMEKLSSPSSSDAFWALDTNDNVLVQLCAALVQCIMVSPAISQALELSFSEFFACFYFLCYFVRIWMVTDSKHHFNPDCLWKKNSINKNNRGGRETDPLNFPIDKCYLLGLTFCHRTRAQKGLTLLACLAPQTEGASTKLGTTFCAVFSFWVSSLKKHHTPQRKLSYKIEFYNSEERAVFLGFLVKMRWKK